MRGLLGAVLWKLGAESCGRILTFIIFILAARSLGPAGFGQIAFALTLANLLYLLTEMGLHQAFLKEGSRLWENILGLKITGTALTVILLPLLSVSLGYSKNMALLVFLGGLWMAGNSWMDLFQCSLITSGKASRILSLILSHRLPVLGICIFLFYTSKETLHWGGAFSLGGILAFGLGALFARGAGFALWPSFSWRVWKGALRISFPIALTSFFGSLYFRLDTLLLSRMRGDFETGLYAAPYRIFESLGFIPAAVLSVILPDLSRAAAKKDSFCEILSALLKTAGLFGFLLFAGLGAFSDFFMRILFGENYIPSAGLFRILLLANAILFMNAVLTHALVAAGAARYNARNTMLCAVFSLLANLILISRWGALGAAITTALTEILLFVLSLRSLRSLLERSIPWKSGKGFLWLLKSENE